MSICSGCCETLSAADRVKGSTASCLKIYHYQCVGITSLNTVEQSTWVCSQCKSQIKRKGDNSETAVRKSAISQDGNDDPGISYVTLRPQRVDKKDNDSSSEILSSMRDEIMAAVTEQLPRIIRGIIDKKLETLGNRILTTEESVKLVSDKYDETTKTLSTQTTSIKKLQSENKHLKANVKELELRLCNAEDLAAKQEQWAKQQNLEIVGIPELNGESLPNLVVKVAEHAALPLQLGDIEFAHRVRAKRPINGKPRAIIVRFRERIIKDSFLSAIRKKRGFSSKDIGLPGESKIYVNEHLTINNKKLLNECKSTAKEHNFKYVWTKNCRIYVRKNDTSPYIMISSEEDLKKVTNF